MRTFSLPRAPRCGPAVAALLAAGCTLSSMNNQQPPERRQDFAENPPRVEETLVELLEAPRDDGRNAVLTVRYAPDRRLGRTVTIEPDSVPIVLADDGQFPDRTAGDLTFAALIRFPVQEAQRRQERLLRLDVLEELIPVFVNRQLVDRTRLDVAEFVPRRPIKIIPLGPLGVVDVGRSLMITDPAVLTDPIRTFNPCTGVGTPMGKWTFGHLMQEMANTGSTGVPASTFVMDWLNQWMSNQTVNTFTVGMRPQIQNVIIQPWLTASGGATLDLSKAPFRLVAIVNRVDLRQNAVYGGGGNAGEGRFVFELVDLQNNCAPLPETVIFEYGISRRGCPAIQNWGQAWANLSGMTPGTPAYNAALEAITVQFTAANAVPSKPNGSALNQLRTNEIALSSPWELREFTIDPGTHALAAATVKRNPASTMNLSPTVANFINANAAAISNGTFSVPNQFPGASAFLGGAAPVPTPSLFWDGPSPSPSASITTPGTRHLFSFNTCDGCHAGETSTFFQHVNGSTQSGFLTGITVTDPAGEMSGTVPTTRTFNDLARRSTDLSGLVSSVCLAQVGFQTLRMVH
jgi:hypothetical protein